MLRNGGSLDWYGGGDAAATIYLAHGSASLANVTFESGEGFALVVRSEATVSCTNVDVAGLGHREWVGLDLVDHATCPP